MAQLADEFHACERCHGFVTVEAVDGEKVRVKCTSCGHTRDAQPQSQTTQTASKWTVIAPDGQVMTFGSWEELTQSRRPPPMDVAATAAHTALTAMMAAQRDAAGEAPAEEKSPARRASAGPQPTGAALLGLAATAPSSPPKLALADDTELDIGTLVAVVRRETSAATQEKPPETSAELNPSTVLDDHGDDEPTPLSLRDAINDEPTPLSLRDAIIEEETLEKKAVARAEDVANVKAIAKNDANDENDEDEEDKEDEDESHEALSLKDLVVVSNVADAIDSTPPPPARGALRTLPPTPAKTGQTMPPPTITVEDTTEPKHVEGTDAARATKDEAPKKDGDDDGGEATSHEQDADSEAQDSAKARAGAAHEEASKRGRRAVASARAAVADEEEAKSGWLAPALAVAIAAVVVWRVIAPSPSSGAGQTPAVAPASTTTNAPTTATVAPTDPTAAAARTDSETQAPEAAHARTDTAAPSENGSTAKARAENTATAAGDKVATVTPFEGPGAEKHATEKSVEKTTDETIERTTGSAATEGAATSKPTPTDRSTIADKATPDNDTASVSDLLDRAGTARRRGDYSTARELYERVLKQNPANVEANGGLGDVARAQGDLNSAKTSYARALAISPSYGPAQLGLADAEWDLGDRAAAQRRYAQIVERLGDRAPERAKERTAATE
jgi:tetratricopeptide (TPR) repeat protein